MTKFSWRRESSLISSGSRKTDSCLVLTECFSSRILRFRTPAIDLIHSERVSTSTSSFFAHRLAYSSHASIIMPKFWCHEYETGSLYFGRLLKRSFSFRSLTILRSPVTIWPHGANINCESEQLQGGGSWEIPWKSSCCKAKQKYRGMFETKMSGNKTSSGEIGLNIRTLERPKVGQEQVSGGASVLCWHAALVANVLWKPLAIR